MLGRTRPASRILLWPRRTRAVRFTTASSKPSHEATAESKEVRENILDGSPRDRFRLIRKVDLGLKDPAVPSASTFSIRRITRNTEPSPWTKPENTLGPVSDASTNDGAVKKWARTRRTPATNTTHWVEKYSAKTWRDVRDVERPERAAPNTTGSHKLPGTAKWANVVRKQMGPQGEGNPFTFNSNTRERRLPTPAHLPPTPFSNSVSPQKKKTAVPSPAEDGAPPRSAILGEMKTWNFDIPSETEAHGEEPEIPPEAFPEDGVPSRSKVIAEMRTWNIVHPPIAAAPTVEPVVVTPSHRVREEKARPAEVLPPLDREFREWLISAMKEAVHDAERNKSNTESLAVYNGPTVLVLNAASRSLIESDFYRLAQQGQHLGDWAVGITRIIQARDPATYEPLGKYYIFFHTRAAALAYSEVVWRLHLLSRRAARLLSTSPLSSFDTTPNPLPLAPTLASERGTEADLEAALKGYTLLPHSAMLDLKLHLCKDLPVPALDRLSALNEKLSPSPLVQGHHFVLVNIEGCKTTVAALHEAIHRDGAERRFPWGLASRRDGEPSIAAVSPESDESKAESWRGRVARSSRFVVPFTDVAEARRFVRNWHRREMRDLQGRNMIVKFNVTALW